MNLKEFKKLSPKKKASWVVGKVNHWRIQLSGYLSIFSFLGVVYLVVRDNPYLSASQVIILMVIGIPLLLLVNDFFIFPATQNEQFERHPRFRKMEDNIGRIGKKLGVDMK